MGVPFPDRRPDVLVAVLGLLLVAAMPARAAEKIAVIDYQQVFDQYEGTTDAQTTLDRELAEWEQEAREKRQEIDALSAEIESQRLMLSEERFREKQDELGRMRDEYERFVEDIWGVNGKAAQRNAELTQPIAERILDVVARIGGEMGVDIILDAGTGGVVWAKDDVNITQTIIQDLQTTAGSGTPSESE